MAATGGKPGSFTFLAAEKPVVFDIVGRGIDHGTMGGWDHTIQGWDNIHQYSHPAPLSSAPEAGLESQPFTPGLPYGAHIHWRWGAGAATGATGIPGGPQYAGAQGPGTPLIDSQIPNQNLEFAITHLDGWFGREEARFLARIDQAPPTFLFRDFSDVWQDLHPVPDTMLPSGNIVIWMSFTVWGPAWYVPGVDFREAPSTPSHTVRYYVPGWGGTVFPQGIFFPHLPDAYFPGRGKFRAIPGVDKAQYLPRRQARLASVMVRRDR